jgi:hypothetical protein
VVSNTFTGKVSYTITSAEGRQVFSGFMDNTLRAAQIDVSRLKAGVYLLILRDAENTRTAKFIVQ